MDVVVDVDEDVVVDVDVDVVVDVHVHVIGFFICGPAVPYTIIPVPFAGFHRTLLL